MRGLAWFAVLLALSSPEAVAQEDNALLEELFRSENVYPQEAGEVQLTFATELDRRRVKPGAASVEVEYGITDAWQVGWGWQPSFAQGVERKGTEAPEGEIELSVKRSFMRMGGSGASLAVGFEAGREGGEAAEGGPRYEYRPFAVIAQDLPRWKAQIFAVGSLDLSSSDEPEAHGTQTERESKTEWGAGGFMEGGPW